MAAGGRADVAVCVDGYSGFVGRGGAGVVTGHIDVPGRAGHAASIDGVSALEKGLGGKAALDRFQAEREASQEAGQGFGASLIRAEIEKIVATAAAGDNHI